jgi:hypothetical protein
VGLIPIMLILTRRTASFPSSFYLLLGRLGALVEFLFLLESFIPLLLYVFEGRGMSKTTNAFFSFAALSWNDGHVGSVQIRHHVI